MKCPHCNVEINESFREYHFGEDASGLYSLFLMKCPSINCKRFILEYAKGEIVHNVSGIGTVLSPTRITHRITIYPTYSSRPKAPLEVDEHIAQDYNEACLVLSLSPKASAALGRRCLQSILRDKAGVKKASLIKEIDEFLSNPQVPTFIAGGVDAIRNIGNFAAHPQKDMISGEIIDVNPGEAEWILDVLESLFDFYYVQPEKLRRNREALNEKLEAAGKPLMK